MYISKRLNFFKNKRGGGVLFTKRVFQKNPEKIFRYFKISFNVKYK